MLLKKTFEIEGLKIEAERKRVRNVRLYISPKDLQVHLTIPFFATEKFALEFVKSKMPWLKKALEKTKAEPQIRVAEVTKEEIEELKRLIANMFPEWEFRLGVKAKGWKLRKMKSQWGNCKTKTGEITSTHYVFGIKFRKRKPSNDAPPIYFINLLFILKYLWIFTETINKFYYTLS